MKKITILAIALFGLVNLVDAESHNILGKETKECLIASAASQTINNVTAYKKTGGSTISNSSFSLRKKGNSWELVSSSGSAYTVYPLSRNVTVNKNVECTHGAGSWILRLYDYVN